MLNPKQSFTLAKYMVDHGFKLNDNYKTHIYSAVHSNDVNVVKYILELDHDNIEKYDLRDMLIFASKKGYVEIVKYLTESDTNIDTQAAMKGAIKHKHKFVVKYLDSLWMLKKIEKKQQLKNPIKHLFHDNNNNNNAITYK